MNAIVSIAAVSFDGAGAFATWLCQQLLAHTFLPNAVYTPPRALYAALYVSPPSAAGGGIEVSGDAAYRRETVGFVARATATASVANAAQVIWPAPRQSWGSVVALGLFDAAVGGNFLNYGLLLGPDGMPTSVPVVAGGEPFVLDRGALTVGLT